MRHDRIGVSIVLLIAACGRIGFAPLERDGTVTGPTDGSRPHGDAGPIDSAFPTDAAHDAGHDSTADGGSIVDAGPLDDGSTASACEEPTILTRPGIYRGTTCPGSSFVDLACSSFKGVPERTYLITVSFKPYGVAVPAGFAVQVMSESCALPVLACAEESLTLELGTHAVVVERVEGGCGSFTLEVFL